MKLRKSWAGHWLVAPGSWHVLLAVAAFIAAARTRSHSSCLTPILWLLIGVFEVYRALAADEW